MISLTDFNYLLDCSGLPCPLNVLKTKRKMYTLVIGDILKVITTDPVSPIDIAAWVAIILLLSCSHHLQICIGNPYLTILDSWSLRSERGITRVDITKRWSESQGSSYTCV